jgi:tetratricopeptide (TPR) repeat protein
MAYIYLKMDRIDEAIEILLKAEALLKDKSHLYLLLGLANSLKGSYGAAEEYYRKTIELNPNVDLVYFYLGALYEKQGKRESAKKEFYRALKINPKNADACNYLGYMYAEEGENLDEAVSLIKRAIQIEPDNGAYIDS